MTRSATAQDWWDHLCNLNDLSDVWKLSFIDREIKFSLQMYCYLVAEDKMTPRQLYTIAVFHNVIDQELLGPEYMDLNTREAFRIEQIYDESLVLDANDFALS
jgi:hypothetical protein